MLIKNNASRLHQIGSLVTLMPGINTVSAEVWAECSKIGLIQHYLKVKELEVADAHAVSLKEKSAADAVALAKDTLNVQLLNSWKGEETRARVVKAIQAQIDLIMAEGEAVTPEEEG